MCPSYYYTKMVALYKDPRGERIFVKSTAVVANGNSTHAMKPVDTVLKAAPPPSEYELTVETHTHTDL